MCWHTIHTTGSNRVGCPPGSLHLGLLDTTVVECQHRSNQCVGTPSTPQVVTVGRPPGSLHMGLLDTTVVVCQHRSNQCVGTPSTPQLVTVGRPPGSLHLGLLDTTVVVCQHRSNQCVGRPCTPQVVTEWVVHLEAFMWVCWTLRLLNVNTGVISVLAHHPHHS